MVQTANWFYNRTICKKQVASHPKAKHNLWNASWHQTSQSYYFKLNCDIVAETIRCDSNSANNALCIQLNIDKSVICSTAILFLHFLMILLLLHSFLFSFADSIGISLGEKADGSVR